MNFLTKKGQSNYWVGFYFLIAISYFTYFWFNLFEYNARGDLLVGQANIWADWALHFTLGNSMAHRELWLQQSPLLINTDFSYPFAVNFISGLLIKAGMPMVYAFVLPSYLFSLLLVWALYFFLVALFQNRTIAVLAAVLFFLNGGVGFYYYFEDMVNADRGWAHWLNPEKEYTHLAEQQIKWISVVTSTILPQRSFTMGFSLTLVALGLVLRLFFNQQQPSSYQQWFYLTLAGILLGLMPIIHMHSFLAAFIFLSLWAITDLIRTNPESRGSRLRAWLFLALLTTLIALPLLNYYYFSHLGGDFVRWFPGWYAKEFGMNWWVFWFKNWTIIPLLALIAFLVMGYQAYQKRQVTHLGLYLPAFLLFALVNLLLMQPWIWDNTKLLAWVSVVFSGLTAWILVKAWQGQKQIAVRYAVRTGIVLLGLLLVSSGFIDNYRNLRFDLHRYPMYSSDEFQLAQWVKEHTPKDSVWIISNKHNHWLSNLTGRQVVMSYDGWLWSHGYDYAEVKNDVEKIFKTADEKRLKKYQVDYLVLDPMIFKSHKLSLLLLTKKFKTVKKLGQYRILEVVD